MRGILIPLHILIITLGCTDQKKTDNVLPICKIVSDPYIKSFWGTNIKYMIRSIRDTVAIDTVRFDKDGNMIDDRGFGFTRQRWEFKDSHTLIRYWIDGDAPEHYLISYASDSNTLIQKHTPIGSHDWNYSPRNTNLKAPYFVEFKLNQRRQVIKETDTKRRFTVSYTYNDSLLIEKEKCDLYLNEISKSQKYFYKDGIIERIETYYGESTPDLLPDLVDYFNNGRLDSTVYYYSEPEHRSTQIYQYIYFPE